MHSVDKTHFTSDADLPISQIATMLEYDSQNSYSGIFRINSALHPTHGENEIGLICSNTKTFFLIIANNNMSQNTTANVRTRF